MNKSLMNHKISYKFSLITQYRVLYLLQNAIKKVHPWCSFVFIVFFCFCSWPWAVVYMDDSDDNAETSNMNEGKYIQLVASHIGFLIVLFHLSKVF